MTTCQLLIFRYIPVTDVCCSNLSRLRFFVLQFHDNETSTSLCSCKSVFTPTHFAIKYCLCPRRFYFCAQTAKHLSSVAATSLFLNAGCKNLDVIASTSRVIHTGFIYHHRDHCCTMLDSVWGQQSKRWHRNPASLVAMKQTYAGPCMCKDTCLNKSGGGRERFEELCSF